MASHYNHFSLGALGAVVKEGQVLLVRTSYAGHRWQFPGGFVEPGESPNAALSRELSEELGARCVRMEYVGTYVRISDMNIVVLFNVVLAEGTLQPDGHEVKDVRYFSPLNAPDEASLRTKLMMKDAAEDRRGRLVVFANHADSGLAL